MIEKAGLKGRKIGGAQVSEKHANFIVNLGDARAKDVLDLIRARKASLISVTPQKSSLEDLFMREVQQQSGEGMSP